MDKPAIIADFIFENKEKLSDQDYINLMNLTKEYYLSGDSKDILSYIYQKELNKEIHNFIRYKIKPSDIRIIDFLFSGILLLIYIF
jgi:hypothetical protein